MRKYISMFLAVMLLCMSLTACGAASAATVANSIDSNEVTAQVTAAVITEPVSVDTVESSGTEAEEGETLVVLSDSTGSVTITEEGTYRVTGTLSNGQIIINAADDAKVKLILDGASITCEGAAAIYAVNADKLVIETAEGSSNLVKSTGEFVQTDDNNVDAAIFAKCDLTLKGEGSLGVVCESGHGVVSKDDLKIKGGTISVEASNQGLSGKDSVTIEDGTVVGGLGSAVAEWTARHDRKTRIRMLGVQDEFVHQGTVAELYARCGMDAQALEATVLQLLHQPE